MYLSSIKPIQLSHFDFEDFKSRNNNKAIGKFNRNFLYTYQFVAAVFLEKKKDTVMFIILQMMVVILVHQI